MASTFQHLCSYCNRSTRSLLGIQLPLNHPNVLPLQKKSTDFFFNHNEIKKTNKPPSSTKKWEKKIHFTDLKLVFIIEFRDSSPANC